MTSPSFGHPHTAHHLWHLTPNASLLNDRSPAWDQNP